MGKCGNNKLNDIPSLLQTNKCTSLRFIFLWAFLFTAGCTTTSDEATGLLTYVDSDSIRKQVKLPGEWAKKRAQILVGMQQAMGKLPDWAELRAPEMKVTDSLREKFYTRFTIRFLAAENESVPAYLYVPSNLSKTEKRPAMLVLHGTGDGGKKLVDGENPKSNRALAKELAERGYVVIAPDYPSMGDLMDYDFGKDRYESGTMKGIFNHMRCVDLLQSMENVDHDRIGVIGHSLGGHNAMFAGAFDERLKVIISSCGWTLMDSYDIGEEGSKKYGGRLGPWAQERYMPSLRNKFGLDAERIPFDFDEIIAALAPRPFFSNSPLRDSNFDAAGVRKGIAAATEVYAFLKAKDDIVAAYPDAEHDFPSETRSQAYQFLDKKLNYTPNPGK